jgi:hypothetical protein
MVDRQTINVPSTSEPPAFTERLPERQPDAPRPALRIEELEARLAPGGASGGVIGTSG